MQQTIMLPIKFTEHDSILSDFSQVSLIDKETQTESKCTSELEVTVVIKPDATKLDIANVLEYREILNDTEILNTSVRIENIKQHKQEVLSAKSSQGTFLHGNILQRNDPCTWKLDENIKEDFSNSGYVYVPCFVAENDQKEYSNSVCVFIPNEETHEYVENIVKDKTSNNQLIDTYKESPTNKYSSHKQTSEDKVSAHISFIKKSTEKINKEDNMPDDKCKSQEPACSPEERIKRLKNIGQGLKNCLSNTFSSTLSVIVNPICKDICNKPKELRIENICKDVTEEKIEKIHDVTEPESPSQSNPILECHIENCPFRQKETEENCLFQKKDTEENCPYQNNETEEICPFERKETEEQCSFQKKETEENCPFERKETEEQCPFRKKETEENCPFERKETEEKCPFRKKEPEENCPFQNKEKEEKPPCSPNKLCGPVVSYPPTPKPRKCSSDRESIQEMESRQMTPLINEMSPNNEFVTEEYVLNNNQLESLNLGVAENLSEAASIVKPGRDDTCLSNASSTKVNDSVNTHLNIGGAVIIKDDDAQMHDSEVVESNLMSWKGNTYLERISEEKSERKPGEVSETPSSEHTVNAVGPEITSRSQFFSQPPPTGLFSAFKSTIFGLFGEKKIAEESDVRPSSASDTSSEEEDSEDPLTN